MQNIYEKYVDYSDKNNIKVSEQIQESIDYIEKNDYNKINLILGAEDKEIMSYYFKQYVKNIIYDTTKAFSQLDEQYKLKRFGSYDPFENYIKQYQEDIEKSFIVQYKIKEYDDYKEYLCKDNYGNYYIFKENEPMDYTVILDQYTIDDKIFTENYKKQEKVGKAQMNLNKFEQMLNRGDYTSAYNVLNEEFKEKYFDSEDKFIEYVSSHFYKYNDFSYTDVDLENEKYKITTAVANIQNSFRENMIKRFKVELQDGGSFSISFDI